MHAEFKKSKYRGIHERAREISSELCVTLYVHICALSSYTSTHKQLTRHLPNPFREFPCNLTYEKVVVSGQADWDDVVSKPDPPLHPDKGEVILVRKEVVLRVNNLDNSGNNSRT